jgi:hypothetical protein
VLRAAVVGAAVLAGSALTASAQGKAPARFPITSVGDSTFSFHSGSARWVARGSEGAVVDPSRRDALVAHFRVLSVLHGDAIALVTGQMTDVTTDHVAVLEAPGRPWYRVRLFWLGLFLGGAVGAVAASR